jgi:nucleotide-binding universal stress UspA family protein
MFKRILAAIDDSDTSALVLAHAIALARTRGATGIDAALTGVKPAAPCAPIVGA